MATIAVTGVSGYLGCILVPRLEAEGCVSRVVGIDVVEPEFSSQSLEFYRMDIRSPELADAITGCDAVVHLAYRQSGSDVDEMRDVNVGGTRLVIEAAAKAGVRKLIYASDTMVYGAHPDNDFPLTEESPLRPVPELPYAAHKAETEGIIDAFAATHPDLVVSVFRICLVAGPAVCGPSARLVESPVALLAAGYDPPIQAVHEDDLARALSLAIREDVPGVYNVCPDDWISLSAAVDTLGQRRLVLDRDRVRRQLELMWRWRLSELHPADVEHLMYPCVAANGKLVGTGAEFRHSSSDALRAAAEARKGWVTVGRVRFRPRRTALVVGSLGAVALGSAVRSAVGRRRVRRETA